MTRQTMILLLKRVIVLCSSLACLSLGQNAVRRGYMPIEGRSVYFEVEGEGSVVLLIHGFSLDSRLWDSQVAFLRERATVIRYDISGFGRSSIPAHPISAINEIVALLKALNVDRVAVIGMSMGGGIAVNLALEYPQLVSGVMTIGSGVNGFVARSEVQDRDRRIIARAADSGIQAAKELWLHDPFLTPYKKTISVRTAVRSMVQDWSGIQFLDSTLNRFIPIRPKAITRLGEIRVPFIAVVGALDDPDKLAVADTFACRIKGAQKIVIPDCGHLVNMEVPEVLNPIISEFLDRIAATDERSKNRR